MSDHHTDHGHSPISLEDRKAILQQKQNEYLTALQDQVGELKSNFAENSRKVVSVGGGLLVSTLFVRALTGSSKQWVNTTDGPQKIKTKESFVFSLLKGAILMGGFYLAKNGINNLAKKAANATASADDSSNSEPESFGA